jgi:hypothetical protein
LFSIFFVELGKRERHLVKMQDCLVSAHIPTRTHAHHLLNI